MQNKGFVITNEDNIREITTFVKHITPSGNIKYAADNGHDDTVMTVVNSTSVFHKPDFREMVDEYASKMTDKSFMTYVNECLKTMEYVEGVDYGQVLKIRRQQMNRYKGGNNNSRNWFGQ